MKISRHLAAAGMLALGFAASALAQDNKLRLITWADYVPADVLAQFKKETGIDVEVTEGAVRKIADEASKSSRIGARALKAVWGKIIKPFEFDPFGQPDVKKEGDRHRLIVDEAIVIRALKPPL